ncbi:putative membrane protein [Halomonas campaniensis]|uniref:Putative membrane protein n=1 Tax=Halomonas campaniensis TaxID=213554 RepID=A0A7W5PBB4_9GAMM|nr:MliC family protein [Halomonas campaniensis]MBB3331432.1 putative membrane protein [Halomonas campaniensis]
MSRLLAPAALGLALLLGGCATATSPAPITPGGQAPLLPSVLFPGDAESFTSWRCTPDQSLVTADPKGPEGELRLWSAHGAWRLQPAVVASGARYEGGQVSFWNRGDAAIVETPRGRLECQAYMQRQALTRQQRPGVMFQGRGNEPGWMVHLANDRPEATLTLDYGTREQTLPYRVTTLDNGAGRVILQSGRGDTPFELRIEAGACLDDMSGEPFPARVTLSVEGEQYRGCGQGIAP